MSERRRTELRTAMGAESSEGLLKESYRILMEGVLGRRLGLNCWQLDIDLTDERLQRWLRYMDDVQRGMPIQYIVGEAFFMDRPYKVDARVLIPRPETEELVDWILGDWNNRQGLRILDVGTGSGCIAIALAEKLSGCQVVGLDNSAGALELASLNAVSHGVDVGLEQADMLSDEFQQRPDRFDIIVSNPPYVTDSDIELLDPSVARFEPPRALSAAGADGLVCYRALSRFASTHLSSEGKLYLELNPFKSADIAAIVEANGLIASEIRLDLSGKPRMLRARLPI